MTDYTRIKKQQERQLLRYFQLAWDDFPKGKIEEGESPDFILRPNKSYSIGIEMTKLYLQKGRGESHFSPHFEKEKSELLEWVKHFYSRHIDFPVTAHFRFSDEYYDINLDLRFLALEISDFIYDRVRNWNPTEYFHSTIRSKRLPAWLDSISLIHHPQDEISDWVYCKVDVAVNHFMESIERTIERKESKMPMYQKHRLDQYWLLIVAECLSCALPFNIRNLVEKWHFHTVFHQLFLFEMFEQRVYVLHI